MPSVSEIFAFLNQGISAVFNWFDRLFLSNGEWYGLILGMVFFVLFARLIITPLFGGRFNAGSDSVKGSDSDSKDE